MIDQDLMIRSVIEATTEVFSTMLDMQAEYTGVINDSRPSGSGLISLVGITGEWGGSGIFCCSPLFAGLMSSRMLGAEFDPECIAINEEILDVVAEMTNMLVGNIKNGLEAVTGPLAISVPTVVHGKNFQFRNVMGLRGVALGFNAESEQFNVRISLAPLAEQNASRPRIPVLGLAQV